MDTRTHRSRRIRAAAGTATLGLAVTGGVVALGGPQATAGEVPPIAVEVLAKHSSFTDRVGVTFRRKLDGRRREVLHARRAGRVVVARLTVQPGAAFPWHTHPGPVVVSVTSGELVYQQASDCVERTYRTDRSFLDPGNRVHTAWNPGEEPTVLVATFYDVPKGGQVTLPRRRQFDRCP
jgi:quercetin dioxygenase-like cupin family protein